MVNILGRTKYQLIVNSARNAMYLIFFNFNEGKIKKYSNSWYIHVNLLQLFMFSTDEKTIAVVYPGLPCASGLLQAPL